MTGSDDTPRTLVLTEGQDRDTSGRLPGPLVAGVLAVGLVVGALVGASAGAASARSYTATTVAAVMPDDALTALSSSAASTPDTNDFIQGELVVITSRDVRAAVQRQLGLAALPGVTATQSGTTDIVDITASAGSTATAQRIADATRSVYALRRQQQLATDVTTAQRQVATQIAAVRTDIANTPGASTDGTGALQQEYARLLAVSSTLALDAASSQQSVTTVQSATPDSSGLSSTATYGLGGAVLGVLLALLALVLLRRLRPRVRSLSDLSALGPDPLLPALPRREVWRAGQVLASRLAPVGGAELVVLIAADGDAGADRAAVAVATALGRRRPVLLVPSRRGAMSALLPLGTAAVGAATLRRGALPAGLEVLDMGSDEPDVRGLLSVAARGDRVVVVATPPLEESDLATMWAAAAGRATVVVGRGRSRPMQVLGTVDALEAAGVGQVTTLLTAPVRGRRSRAVEPTPPPAGGAPPAPAPREPAAVPTRRVSLPDVAAPSVQQTPDPAATEAPSPAPASTARPTPVAAAPRTVARKPRAPRSRTQPAAPPRSSGG